MGEAGRCLLPIGVILRILDWTAMRGSYGAASFSMAAWVACEHGERQNQRVLTTTASAVQSP